MSEAGTWKQTKMVAEVIEPYYHAPIAIVLVNDPLLEILIRVLRSSKKSIVVLEAGREEGGEASFLTLHFILVERRIVLIVSAGVRSDCLAGQETVRYVIRESRDQKSEYSELNHFAI